MILALLAKNASNDSENHKTAALRPLFDFLLPGPREVTPSRYLPPLPRL